MGRPTTVPRPEWFPRGCARPAWPRPLEPGLVRERLLTEPRLQVIAAKIGSHLPIEYCYTRTPPKSTAGLCPNALTGLRGAGCPGNCTSPGDEGLGYLSSGVLGP